MTFISYGQNFEDVILWRALKHIDNGFYIDVGANDPQDDSITKSFYDRGWHGINLEPLPAYHQLLCEQRTRDINLAVAAGSAEGEITLFDTPEVRGWATSDASVANRHIASGVKVEPICVPVRTLSGIWDKHVAADVHFLKIDVEGFEGEVIKGLDFKKYRPWIVIIEALLPNSMLSSHASWEPALLEADYAFAYFDGLNRYYVAVEHNELMPAFGLQPNVFDDFITTGEVRATEAWVATKKSLAILNDAVHVTEKALGMATQARAEAEQELACASEALFVTEENLMRAVLGKQREQANGARVQAELERALFELQKAVADTQAEHVKVAQLSDRLMQAQAHIHALEQLAHMRQAEITAIHATLSWRITRPLRIAKLLLKDPRQGWQKIRARSGLVRIDAKNWLVRSIRWAVRQPRLMRLAVWILKRSPALDIKAREMNARIKHIDTPPPVAPMAPELPDHMRCMPVSSRKVLADLHCAKRQT